MFTLRCIEDSSHPVAQNIPADIVEIHVPAYTHFESPIEDFSNRSQREQRCFVGIIFW